MLNQLNRIVMSIIAKTILRNEGTIAKDNRYYGNIQQRSTIIEEEILDKFEGVNCPNQGVEVGFKYGKNTFVLQANKYAFSDIGNFYYNTFIRNNNFEFELVIKTDENGNIDFNKDETVVHLYEGYSSSDWDEPLASVEVEYMKHFE